MAKESYPGVRRCIKCNWLFVTQDVLRIRKCSDCKRYADDYLPRTAKTDQMDSVVKACLESDKT